LAGRVSGEFSKISRSAVTFSIEMNSDGTSGSGYLGGIAGFCDMGGAGGTASVIIEKSYSAGLIALSKAGGDAYAGGLIGYHHYHQTAAVGSAVIAECFASGNVGVSGSGGTLAAGGLTGGSDAAPGLVIDRSCALMEAVTASSATAPLASAGGLSGYQLAGSSSTFQLDSIEIKESSTPGVDAGEFVNRSSLGGSWFGGTPLQWDLADTWQWDADAGRLKFRWQ
jgi:hypothetical protein